MEDIVNCMPENATGIFLNERITIVGIGGAGCNAVNHMYNKGIKDVDFIVCNTDAQSLAISPVPSKIQLGKKRSEGRGAGNQPGVGRECAIESLEEITERLKGTHLLFLTAGMGGGTGTGAAPVIAEAARKEKILTIGVVSIPFKNEGAPRIEKAIDGIDELKKHVDGLIVLNSERLLEEKDTDPNLSFAEAMAKIDNILAKAVSGISDMIKYKSKCNLDLEDLRHAMRTPGCVVIGTGRANGPDRAKKCLEQALNSPILYNDDIYGAKDVLVNIMTSGEENAASLKLSEFGYIQKFLQNLITGHKQNISPGSLSWGQGFNDELGEDMTITIVATGYSDDIFKKRLIEKKQVRVRINKEGEAVRENTSDEKDETKITYDAEEPSKAAKMQGLYERTQKNRPTDYMSKKLKPTECLDLTREENLKILDVPAYLRRCEDTDEA